MARARQAYSWTSQENHVIYDQRLGEELDTST